MGCLFAIMRKEFRHMLRDPWMLAGVTVGTALLMVLMAYTFSADIAQVPLGVWDGDRSLQSRLYLTHFNNDDFFDLAYGARSQQEVYDWVQTGRVRAAIVVPPGFGQTALRGQQAPIQLIIDGSEPNTTHQVLGNATALSANFSGELLAQRLAGVGLASGDETLPLTFRTRTLYNPDLEEINSILPGLMAIALAMPALAASLSLVREKEQGSLEGLMATPIPRYQLLAGKIIPYLLLGLVDIFFLTWIGLILFGVPFQGRLSDLVLFASLFLLANLGIGLLISSLVNTQMAALVIAGLIFILPSINESGLFFPLYAMSSEARLEAMMWPATHFVIITRGIFLKGAGIPLLWSHGLYLLALGLLLNGLAVWRLKKKVA